MVIVYMLSRRLWTFQLPDCDHEFFELCGAAVGSLLARGLARSDIEIDYEKETAKHMGRKTAKRFVHAYGARGARFMADGIAPAGDECPPLQGGIEEHRALRKIPRVCPHCDRPIRPQDWIRK